MNKRILLITACWLLLLVGVSLTVVNVYGLSQHIRPSVFFHDELRFENDVTLNLDETLAQVKRLPDETEQAYASRVTQVIANGLAHIHWERFENTKFNQLIPIWENYFIYFMGILSGIPEYERYHFADYQRSLERGIGICGDASMIMSQLLDKQGIENQLITFPGHVILSAKFSDGTELAYDPDFGVPLGYHPDQIKQSPALINSEYRAAGYTLRDLAILNRIYNNGYERWNGVEHFITKKYYFEKISYWLKWPLPIIMILLGFFVLCRVNSRKSA